MEEYASIIKALEKYAEKDTEEIHDLIQLMKRIMDYLMRKEPKLKERMSDVMGGKVLPLP